MRSRGLACLAVLGLLALGGCDDGDEAVASDRERPAPESAQSAPTGRQTFRVRVDGPSAVKVESYVFGTYFPMALTARPGDTVVFENVSSHDIHTVTFGLTRDRSNSPLPETKTVQANPAVFGPCFTDTDPTPDLEACPAAPPATPPQYAGRGYWNSGVFFPAGAPAPMPTSVTVELDPTIATGAIPIPACCTPGWRGQWTSSPTTRTG